MKSILGLFMVLCIGFQVAMAQKLEILQAVPDGPVRSLTDAQEIDVTFSQPMVPLTKLPVGNGSGPLQISPAVNGKFRWKGTDVLAFVPDQPFALATLYTVTIPKGLTSAVSREPLQQEYKWTFSTPTPKVIYTTGGNENMELNRTIFVQFNQPVDIASVRRNFSIKPDVDFNIFTPDQSQGNCCYSTIVSGQYEKFGSKRVDIVGFQPKIGYSLGTKYTLTIKPGIASAMGGPLTSTEEHIITFETFHPLIFKGFHFGTGTMASESDLLNVDPHGQLRATFNNPVNLSQYVKYVHLKPEVPFPQSFTRENWSTNEIDLNQGLKPLTTYEVTIDADIADVYGNNLGQSVKQTIKTGNLNPWLKTLTGLGIVEFAGNRRIPLELVNIKELPIRARKLNMDQIVPMIQQRELFSSNALNLSENETMITMKFGDKPNLRQRVPLYLDTFIHKNPGVMFLQVTDPFTTTETQYHKSLLQVTNLGLTAKFGYDNTLIAVTSLDNALPVSGASVDIRNSNNTIVWTGKTDVTGKVTAPSWNTLGITREESWGAPKQYIFASKGNDWAFISSDWESGISPWRFNLDYQWNQTPTVVYSGTIVTDRDLYRPGETVFGKGFVRYLENNGWNPVKHTSIEIVVSRENDYSDNYDEEGENSSGSAIILKDTIPFAKIGSFEFKCKVPSEARLGRYAMTAHVVGFEKEMNDKKFSESIHGTFTVAEFQPAEIETKVVSKKSDYLFTDTLEATISGQYLFGAPVKNEKIGYILRKEPLAVMPKGYEEYSFEDYYSSDDYSSRYQNIQAIRNDSIQLDEKGFAHCAIPLIEFADRYPWNFQLEATVVGKAKQPITGSVKVAVHPTPWYVGIKTSDFLAIEKKPVGIKLAVVTPDGDKAPTHRIALTIKKRWWVSVKHAELGGRYNWESHSVDSICYAGTVQSDSLGLANINFTPNDAGYYIARAALVDSVDTLSVASTALYACGSSYAPWARSNDDYLDIIADKKRYSPGQTAKLLVKSPYTSARALVTVEREGVLSSFWVDLAGSASTIDLPITKAFLPNVFVSVMILRGRSTPQQFDDEGGDLSKPAFKIGYCALAVEPDGKRLQVVVKPAQKEYQPGDSVSIKISVPKLSGKPYASEALVMAVDEGVLLLSGYKTPDVFSFFYGPRPLCVLTTESRAAVVGERNYGEKGQNRGGGGGVDPSLFARIMARGNFKMCAYFNPRAVLDKNGEATVRFKLPDNLSTFRIMVVAQSAAAEFGSGDARITVNKKLMLRPQVPRFLRMGDSCFAGVVAENYTPLTDTLILQSEITRVNLPKGQLTKAVVPNGSNAYVFMPIIAGGKGDSISYTFKGKLSVFTDGVTGTIPLLYERAIETVAFNGSTTDSTHQLVTIPDSTIVQYGSLNAALSSTAMQGLGESVRYLFEYPYGCLEQRTSRVLPLILFEEMMSAFNINMLTRDDVASVVQDYLNHVKTYQCSNGGFDYWTPAKHDSPYLTTFAVQAIIQAEKKGYRVDRDCKKRALEYLSGFLDGICDYSQYPYSEIERNSVEATIVGVLAEGGTYRADAVERLFKKRVNLSVSAIATLYKAVAIGKGDPQIRSELLRQMNNSAKIETATIHFTDGTWQLPWLHSSTVTTTSIVLLSALSADSSYPQAEKVVRWLMQEQKTNRWNSTHENLYAFWALAKYFSVYESETPDFKAVAKLNGKEWFAEHFTGRSSAKKESTLGFDTLPIGKTSSLDFIKQGPGRLYYSVHMKYAPMGGVAARNEGIEIKRQYMSVDKKRLDPSEFKVGQPVVVTLTVTSNRDRMFVAVNDPVPAGCEIIDPSLSVVSPELGRMISDINANTGNYWWGSWNHTEYRDQRCLLFANYLNAGTHTFSYLLRPTIEGKYYTPPAHAEEMYNPEVFGRTDECMVKVKK